MSEVKVDKISPKTGTSMTVGDSGDTFTVPSGATLTVAGALNVTGTTSLADGTVAVAELDIDGATDINAAIVDADLFVVDDGAGGTNRKTAASRLKTFILADNSLDSDMYVDGSIDNAHLADDAVDSDEIAAGAIDAAHMSANSIDSASYVDGSIDTAHIADDQITLAKMASGTDGNIISYDASGNPVAIATGSDGQVLTSAGSGQPPAFEAAPGGRATLIDTITLSSSSTAVFDSSDITSTYDNYLITLENVHPGSGNVEVLMRISNNNGSSYEGDSANDYRFISFNGIENESNNSFTSRYSTASNKIGITGNYSNNGNDAALKIDSTIECFSLNSSSYKKFLIRSSFSNPDDPPKLVYEHNLALADSTQAVINNIKIYPSSGNFASGKIKLFGLA